MTIRILIADDSKIIRQGLHLYLSMDPEIEIIGDASNGMEALEKCFLLRPDVVVMDLLMPFNGVIAIASIRKELPTIEVVALSSVLEDGSVIEAIKAGAICYILKDTNSIDLCKAIHAAAAGQVQLPPKVVERLLAEVHLKPSKEKPTESDTTLIRLIAGGKSNKEIALLLQISEATVIAYVQYMLTKFNLASRTQAALYAVRLGLASFV